MYITSCTTRPRGAQQRHQIGMREYCLLRVYSLRFVERKWFNRFILESNAARVDLDVVLSEKRTLCKVARFNDSTC